MGHGPHLTKTSPLAPLMAPDRFPRLAILSLIRQSVASFAVEQRAGDLQQLVQKFSEQWVKYNEKVESVGKSLATTQKHFDDLNSTRTKALERPMDKIIGLNLEDSATVETEDSE